MSLESLIVTVNKEVLKMNKQAHNNEGIQRSQQKKFPMAEAGQCEQ